MCELEGRQTDKGSGPDAAYIVKHILKCTAWRRAREGWREEAKVRPKLEVMGRLMDCIGVRQGV